MALNARIYPVAVVTFVSLLTGCAQLRGGPAEAPGGKISYTLRLLEGSPRGVQVTLTARGADEGRTVLAVAKEWGGINAEGNDIIDLSVRDDIGPLTFEHPHHHQWIVEHQPGAPLTVSYVLRPPADRKPLERANDYRTHLTDTLFRMFGNHGLIHPEHEQGPRPRSIRLDWRGFDEAGWKVVSSYGADSAPVTLSMSLDEFRHALFLAGDIRVYQRDVRGQKLGVALYGQWRFGDEEFVDQVNRIILAEREFFNDFEDPWYLVSLVPTGDADPNSLSLGGTAVTNCFALFVSPNAELSPGDPGAERIPRVLTHEYFHRWNGGRYNAADPEQLIYWFSEGFTDFYARRIMLRAGMLTPEEYAADLNESIRNYHLSPVRTASNERIVGGFWSDRNLGELPYRRGDLVAVLLDEQIRDKSGGRKCLDDFMRELLARGQESGERLSTEHLLQRIAEYTDAAFADTLRRIVVDGAEIPLPSSLHEPELARTARPAYAFDLGFDDARSREAKAVVGVREGSAAHAAGLRDGQRMLGWSVHFGHTDREVELTIEENGARKQIKYLPRGAAVEVPFYEPRSKV